MEELKRIGKYELEEFLGGGMSHVYKARDTVIGRTVAVKILTPAAAADPEAKARFLREAQMAGGMAHENIMNVYDFGEEQGRAFMVMEFLRGEDLRSAMQNGRTGDTANRLRIALQIARALEFIHQQKIIHRDIKPENIHISSNGTVKLMDFGIAKTADLSMTRPGFTMGTPSYMSPEQVVGREVTHLSDVYSFGALLFELLAGAKAVAGDTVEQLFYRILNEPVDMTPLRQARLAEPLYDLIGKCLAKAPADRPSDMSIIRGGIEQLLEPERPAMAAELPGRRAKWMVPVAVGVLLVVLFILALLYFPRREEVADVPPDKAEPRPILATPTGEMVLIPAGTAPAFYMDRTEVTNEAYARFCAERQRPLPPGFPRDRADYPIVNITIVDAQEFAKWAGKRLPDKHEWERAARGNDGRAYPWGNSRDPILANVADNPTLSAKTLMPVNAFRQGASPYGVLQMAGNAWEFVDELITPSPGALQAFAKILSPPPTADEPWYTIRGGAFDIPLIEDAAFEWSAVPARFRAPDIGFRCAREIGK